MDKLRLYQEILDLCEIGEDYSQQWFQLFGTVLENGTTPLTLENVMHNVVDLGFDLFIGNFDDEIKESTITNFVQQNNVDTKREFFDFVREIVEQGGVVRFEEPLTNDNFRIHKRTAFAYAPTK